MSDTPPTPSDFYDRILNILQTARTSLARTVNTTQVLSNWLIGREIIEQDQTWSRTEWPIFLHVVHLAPLS